MILTDNVFILKKYLPNLWSSMQGRDLDALKSGNVEVAAAKNGSMTMTVQKDNQPAFVHSKYNPQEEAKKFVEQFHNIKQYDHVLFYGVGLGYHIEAFLEMYPNIGYTLYEPSMEIFAAYLSHRLLPEANMSRLKHVFIEGGPGDTSTYLGAFVQSIKDNVLVVALPSYERLFKDRYHQFSETFIKLLANRKDALQTNAVFEKRWTINSLYNFKEVLRTPSINYACGEHFKDKPVLLVSAGPSLNDELDNLRLIKEKRTAYIFSVGSAINVLLSNGIHPDAACTYDPSPENARVFQKVLEEGIVSIPLVFGSSVGLETLQNYPGPKIHMLTSQDTVAAYYLQRSDNEPLPVVLDAPSIAVITLQLLCMMQCGPIILVGQNLAYRNDEYYAKGIDYYQSLVVNDRLLANAIQVEDVEGNPIYTNDGFNRMRLQLEYYIELFGKNKEIINTTKGGAKIQGAPFITLEQLMKKRLKKKVVKPGWFEGDTNTYDAEKMKTRHKQMLKERDQNVEIMETVLIQFSEMNQLAQKGNPVQLEKLFKRFDKNMKKMLSNDFFQTFLKPMNRNELELLQRQIEAIKFEKNLDSKVNKIADQFGKVILACGRDYQMIKPMFDEMAAAIEGYSDSYGKLVSLEA